VSGRFLLTEFLNRHHVEMSLGQLAEQIWELGVHAVDVLGVEIQNFLA
jgi:hypothetical protein